MLPSSRLHYLLFDTMYELNMSQGIWKVLSNLLFYMEIHRVFVRAVRATIFI